MSLGPEIVHYARKGVLVGDSNRSIKKGSEGLPYCLRGLGKGRKSLFLTSRFKVVRNHEEDLGREYWGKDWFFGRHGHKLGVVR
jgi:hypothetical protein